MESTAPEDHGAAVEADAAAADFLRRFAGRDFEGLRLTLAHDATARLVLPAVIEHPSGRDAIVEHVEGWFGSATTFTLAASTQDRVGARHRITWRFEVVRDGGPAEVIEQLVFLDIGTSGIEHIDLLCSGFQREASSTATQPEVFDAGAMGCADGLAQAFRRRLSDVPVGASLRVVVRDPAAKEDLPSMARMLGQSITSTEAHEDGRLSITVERRK